MTYPHMTKRISDIHREIMEQAGDDAEQWGLKYDVLVDAVKEIDWLNTKVAQANAHMATAASAIERLTAERDEARRMCCEQAAMAESGYVKHGDMLHFAESRGWDCFQQEDNK